MQIVVKLDKPGEIPEWGIIELQGDLEVRDDAKLDGQFIGDLHYTRTGQPILIIGHHILQGKEQTMDEPFALLEKKTVHSEADTPAEISRTIDDSVLEASNTSINTSLSSNRTVLDSTLAIEEKSKSNVCYVVKALIKKKLVFKTRPKPIIANVPKNV
ncbi:chromosome transmission fidelity protein 8 homolog [Ctenocephalides felis]|uniref:chromosome transmission fidelity protein 8 homolog n=1 Tax=Ctenocephalides felis TaxID=7515 RepID=UPI000E6E4CED|nr:chromosome transmission fidelity protein 8 homolog [Ctenocephalides felis]